MRRDSHGLHPGRVCISAVPTPPGQVTGQKVHRVLHDGEPPGLCPLGHVGECQSLSQAAPMEISSSALPLANT